MKKSMVKEAVDKGLLKENGTDNWLKSYTWTEKWYKFGWKWKGVHLPDKVIPKPKLSEQLKAKKKEVKNNIKEIKKKKEDFKDINLEQGFRENLIKKYTELYWKKPNPRIKDETLVQRIQDKKLAWKVNGELWFKEDKTPLIKKEKKKDLFFKKWEVTDKEADNLFSNPKKETPASDNVVKETPVEAPKKSNKEKRAEVIKEYKDIIWKEPKEWTSLSSMRKEIANKKKEKNHFVQWFKAVDKILDWKEVRLDTTTKALNKLWSFTEWVKTSFMDVLWSILSNIKVEDAKWRVINWKQLLDWLRSNTRTFTLDYILNKLWFKKIAKLEKENWDAINKWYKVVEKNLNTLWNSDKAKFIKMNIKDISDENHSRHSFTKNINSTKNRAVINYVRLKTKLLKEQLQKQLKQEEEAKLKWKKLEEAPKLTEEQKQEIYNSVLSEFPKETQEYIQKIHKELFKKDWEWLYADFDKIWDELIEAGILKPQQKKENYLHWYIPWMTFKEYGKYLRKNKNRMEAELWKDTYDELLKAMEDKEHQFTPEQMSKILKKSKNVWYLRSENPLDIITSYANELTKTKEQQEIIYLLRKLQKASPEIREYLDKYIFHNKSLIAGKENNFLYNQLLWIKEKQWPLWKAGNKISTALAHWMYQWNVPMTGQNLVAWTAQFLGQLVWRWLSWELSVPPKDITNVRKFLINDWVIAHKDYNIDTTTKWNIPLSKKIAPTIWKTLNKTMRAMVATWVPHLQSLLAWGMMKKFIKKYWTYDKNKDLVTQYKETLQKVPKDIAIDQQWKLAEAVKRIEDNTYSAKSPIKWVNNVMLNMIKSYSNQFRWQLTEWVTDTIDALTPRKTKATKSFNKWIWNSKTKRIVKNVSDLNARLVIAWIIAGAIASTFKTENEKKQMTEKLFAKNLEDFLLNIYTQQYQTIWPDIFSNVVLQWAKDLTQLWYADNDENRKEYAQNFLKHFFTWINKATEQVQNFKAWELGQWDFVRHTSKSGWFSYKDTKPTSWLWYIFGVNKWSADHNQYYEKEKEIYKEIPKTWTEKLDNIVNSNRTIQNILQSWKALVNAQKQAQIKNMVQRMKSLEGKKVTPEQWLNIVVWKDKENWNIKAAQKNKLWSDFFKDTKTTLNELTKINKIFRDFKRYGVNIYTNDFNKTLDELKVKNPKLYNRFMTRVLWTAYNDKDWKTNWDATIFVQNIINQDLNWALLKSSISERFRKLNDKLLKYHTQWKVITKADELVQLDQTLKIMDNFPTLKKQIYDALVEVVAKNLPKSKDTAIYMAAVKGYPELEKVYRRAWVLRWWVLKDKKEEPKKLSEILKSWQTPSKKYNWTNTWLPKWKWLKLSNLIPLEKLKLDKVIQTWQNKIQEVTPSSLSFLVKKK